MSRNSEYTAHLHLVPQRAPVYHLESSVPYEKQRRYEDAARMHLNVMRAAKCTNTRRLAVLLGILAAEVVVWLATNL